MPPRFARLRLCVHIPIFALLCLAAAALQACHRAAMPAPEPAPPSTAPADIAAYCPALRQSSDPFFGTQQRQRLLAEVNAPSYDTHSWRISIARELARDHLRFGETDDAIRILSDALDAELSSQSDGSREADLLQDLAVAHLKEGELRNCVSPEGRLICALPLDPSLAHADKRGSASAVRRLTRLLELEPQNLRGQWLLNIAHMTLGSYPHAVPPRFRVPQAALQSPQYRMRRFDEIAPYAGLYAVNTAGGSIIEDFDNDGLLDIMTSTWDPCRPIAYYRNQGNGRFADYTQRAGLGGQLGGLNIVQTDYNNDGFADVLIMRGGWMRARGQMRMSLLRNDGGGAFTDVTRAVGLALPAYPSQSAAWADYDGDGDLDLFSCSETTTEAGVEAGALIFPSRLFRNHNGVFTDVTADAGVANMRFCKGSAWGDYDNDGDPDLYISNFGEPNRLYRNDGGAFTDVAPQLGVEHPIDSFAVWFWDYDNDGRLDIFAAGYGDNIADVAADYLGLPNNGARPRLYRNTGGGFQDVTQAVGLDSVHLAMGANFGDLDNDGYPDFYLGTGYPAYEALAPNIMYRNDNGIRFQDVTFAGGFGHLQKGHGVSFGDLDNDGDQDIFAQIGGFYPGDGFVNALYRNPGGPNRWLSVKLIGAQSNRAAIGARLNLTLAEPDGGERSVHTLVGSGGSFGASTLTQEIGLGQAQRIISLEVHWPATDIRQTFADVPMNAHIRIREDAAAYEILHRPPIPLGVAPSN